MNQLIRYHLLLCATSLKAKCCDKATGIASWEHLKKLIREKDLENPNNPKGIVMRSKVDCLRICKDGPILLVWPDGIWYGSITPNKIERIVNDHLLKSKPISKWIIRHTPQLTCDSKNFIQNSDFNSHRLTN